MGYYPKHLKQRRHNRAMGLIARAALAGCIFERCIHPRPGFREGANVRWANHFPDGGISVSYWPKSMAAWMYLEWFLSKASASWCEPNDLIWSRTQ